MLNGALLVVVGNPRLVLSAVLAQEHGGGPAYSLMRKPVPELQDLGVGDHRKLGKMISELRGQRSAKFGSS